MNQNRRAFLGTLGLFSILPGAGRVWKAIRADPAGPTPVVWTIPEEPTTGASTSPSAPPTDGPPSAETGPTH